MKEVFEDISDVCDAVTLERTIGFVGSGDVGSIWYFAPHMDSTLLRCCLAQEDWHENILACDDPEPQDPEVTYEYDPEANDGAGQCFERTCIRSNIYAPGSGARKVLVQEGECVEQPNSPAEVSAAVCCEQGLQEACENEEDVEEREGPEEVIDVTCDPKTDENAEECGTCTIESFPVTEYVDRATGEVINSVTSEEPMTRQGTRAECCAAGVSAMDAETIEAACLQDDGEPEDELELTDNGECIQRSVQKKAYLDMGMEVEGYESFDEVLDTQIVHPDECCNQGCMGEEFTSFLAACSSRMETPGMKSYDVSEDNMFCIETQEVIIIYGLENGDEACSVTAGVEKSSQFEGDEVPEYACCRAAFMDEDIATSVETYDELDAWCNARDETKDGSILEFDDSKEPDGECKMEMGEIRKAWYDSEDAMMGEEVVATPFVDVSGQVLDKNSYCCLAYMEEGEINTSPELLFACEEITEPEEVIYDFSDGMCFFTTINFMYVDRNVNMEYDEGVDDQFAYEEVGPEEDVSGDVCCEQAGLAADLDTLMGACDQQEEKRSDEFFTYDAPTCTVQYDKEVCYFTSEQDPAAGDMPVYMETEHCIKEEVPAEACCQAKRDGKAGMGLEDACTTLTISPSGDSQPAEEPETTEPATEPETTMEEEMDEVEDFPEEDELL